MKLSGHTCNLLRFQTHDGPGLRTTVFMKGCPLKCAWCHNPESMSPANEIWWLPNQCIACSRCVDICPEGAISGKEGYNPDRQLCCACGQCVQECPANAREELRTTWTVDELVSTVVRDRAFMQNGGVTVSGGEPARQSEFVSEFLRNCQDEGLHTALDTCGAVNLDRFSRIMPHCDLILFDLKLMDADEHRRWTGTDNSLILENLKYLAEYAGKNVDGPELWIRTPLVPGATATEDNIQSIGHFLHNELGGVVKRWELCAFNNLCSEKYIRLGLEWDLAAVPLLDMAQGEKLLKVARESAQVIEDMIFLKGGMAREEKVVEN